MSRNLVITILIIVIILIGLISAYFLTQQSTSGSSSITTTLSGPLLIWVADAYTAEAQDLGNAFKNLTGVNFAIKSAGSLTLARQIAQGGQVSVFMPVALEAASKDFLRDRYSGWVIAIAADQIVLAYSNSTLNNPFSRYLISLAQKGDWYDFFYYLTNGSVKVGIADPTQDPAGFRGVLSLELAGIVFANNNSQFFLNRIVQNNGNVSAAHAADLVNPLVAGQIQFLYIYKSAAIAKGLNYIQLPPQINLGDPKYADLYKQAYVKLPERVIYGAPIYWYITIPKNATNYETAIQFLIFVVKNGGKYLIKYGLTPLSPSFLYNSTQVPIEIQQLISQGYLVMKGSV